MSELTDGAVVDRRPSAAFRNLCVRLAWTESGISITSNGETENFAAMFGKRSDAANLAISAAERRRRLSTDEGVPASNVGISLPIVCAVEGREYALLVHRRRDNRVMLLSGYVDASRAAAATYRDLVLLNVLEEAREEIVLGGAGGTAVCPGAVNADLGIAAEILPPSLIAAPNEGGYQLGVPYASLVAVAGGGKGWSLTPCRMPRFLPNVSAWPVSLDGAPTSCGFQYGQQWNAGQLFFPFELKLPSDLAGCELFHAEDELDPEDKSLLRTVVTTQGFLFIELDSERRLTAKASRLRAGKLAPCSPDLLQEARFSEAFAPSPLPDVAGFVSQSEVSTAEYFSANAINGA